jgi:hypothetical protein
LISGPIASGRPSKASGISTLRGGKEVKSQKLKGKSGNAIQTEIGWRELRGGHDQKMDRDLKDDNAMASLSCRNSKLANGASGDQLTDVAMPLPRYFSLNTPGFKKDH